MLKIQRWFLMVGCVGITLLSTPLYGQSLLLTQSAETVLTPQHAASSTSIHPHNPLLLSLSKNSQHQAAAMNRSFLPSTPLFDSTTGRGFQLLRMTPNPIHQTDELTIQFRIFTRHPLQFRLVDLTGRIILNGHWQFLSDGKYEVRIPLYPLATGRYLLILDAVGRPLVIPIVILR